SSEPETLSAIQNGTPSEWVIARILKSVEFTKQEDRLRSAVWGTLGFVMLILGTTVFYSTLIVGSANREVASANQKVASANRKVASAVSQETAAETKQRTAEA